MRTLVSGTVSLSSWLPDTALCRGCEPQMIKAMSWYGCFHSQGTPGPGAKPQMGVAMSQVDWLLSPGGSQG